MSAGPDDSGGGWASPGGPPPPSWAPEQPPPAPGWAPPPGGPTAAPGWGAAYAPPPAPRPGIVPLRPLGVGELLDGAFTAIRRYPKATLGLAACVMLAVQVVEVATQYWLLAGITPPRSGTLADAADYTARVGTAAILNVLVVLLATLVLTGLVTAVIGEAVLGRPVTVSQAWGRLRPVFWRLAGASALAFVLPLLVPAVLALPGIIVLAVGGGTIGGVLLVVGLVAGVPLMIWLYFLLVLAPAAVVLEQQTVRGALRRSRALVRRSWWRVFWILLLASVIASVVSGIISLPFTFAGGGLTSVGGRTSAVQLSQLVITGIGGLLAGTIVRPFSAGVAALLYIDRRMRAEALDMALVRAAAEPPPG
jgi:hypothetical protein